MSYSIESDIHEKLSRQIKAAEALDASFYVSPEIFQAEKKNIFSAMWHYVGSTQALREPGCFMSHELNDVPLVTVRGKDNLLRTFHNVCRHRAGPLASGEGKARLLTCQYHAWSYGLDGQLVGAPQMEGAENFDKKKCRLPEVKTAEWAGMLFVNLNSDAAPFDQTVAGIEERIRPILMSGNFFKRVVYTVEANWKVYIDNYLEGYHVPVIHPELTAQISFARYTTELFSHYSLQHSPLEKSEAYSTTGHVWYYFLFPNIMLNILPGRVQVNSVLPLGLDKTQVIFDYYFDDQEDLERIEKDLAFSDLVQAQDATVCQAVQKAFRSGSYLPGRLCPAQELGLFHFQEWYREKISGFGQ